MAVLQCRHIAIITETKPFPTYPGSSKVTYVVKKMEREMAR